MVFLNSVHFYSLEIISVLFYLIYVHLIVSVPVYSNHCVSNFVHDGELRVI